jgi:hypothetical protein
MASTLDTFLAERRGLPFAYFQQDCAHIAADWVLEKTGRDPLAEMRGEGGAMASRNLLTTMRAVREVGGMQAMGDKILGAAIPPLTAQRGDIVLIKSGRPIGRVSGFTFGICTGSNIAVPDNDGLVFQPISAGVAAWRV